MSTRLKRAYVRRQQRHRFRHLYTASVKVRRSGQYADGSRAINIKFGSWSVDWELDILPESFEAVLECMMATDKKATLCATAAAINDLAGKDSEATQESG